MDDPYVCRIVIHSFVHCGPAATNARIGAKKATTPTRYAGMNKLRIFC